MVFRPTLSRIALLRQYSMNNITTNKRFRHWPQIVFLTLTGAGLYLFYKKEKLAMQEKKFVIASNTQRVEGEARVGGPFSLLNQDGKRVTEADFAGKYMLLYFGFTHCPDICPDELEKATIVMNRLQLNPKTKDKLTPIFVSIDPKRDGPAQLKKYLQDFHPSYVGLTGTPEEIISLAKSYRVYCAPNYLTSQQQSDAESGNNYLVDHSVFFYLMGPDNKFVDFFGRDATPDAMYEKIQHHILIDS